MSHESCSFEIGDRTLIEIERQANIEHDFKINKTPLTSKSHQNSSNLLLTNQLDGTPSENHQKSIVDRFNIASQKARNRRKFEKSKSNSSIDKKSYTSSSNELNSISNYLQDEEIDFSAWEMSAAKLISPAVAQKDMGNLFDCFEYFENSEHVSSGHEQDHTMTRDVTNNTAVPEIIDCSSYDLDNVTYLQQNVCDSLAQELNHNIENELLDHKSLLESSDIFLNESVIPNLPTFCKFQRDESLILRPETNRLISSWNLPISLVRGYHKKNVFKLFEWQIECLTNPKVLFEQKNLLYSAPTSAGKTLVSEILMIKTIVERNKKALMILPFVSIVREKMFYLQDIMESSGLRVDGFFGGYQPPGGLDAINLAVCTIEKANSIVNKLMEQDKLKDIGIIVVDEIHLLSDPSRGYILELLLTKILYMCDKYKYNIQIVAMSANLVSHARTDNPSAILPNADDDILRKWLKAEYYYTDFRPVELHEMIKIGKQIFDCQMNLIRTVDQRWIHFANDTDEVCHLAMETILENYQLIIFCPSKEWCEQLSTNMARGIHSMMKENLPDIEGIFDKSQLKALLEQFKDLHTGVDQALQKCLAYGCAYHHAGLTNGERDLIEMAFKDGIIKVLVATSTLSSGVNLPARRVIIRTPMFGKKIMSNLSYRQMIGRAGRKGKDTLGESILICSQETSNAGKQLVAAQLEPIVSCLDADDYAHLKRAILEVIASGVASSKHDLEMFLSSTLFCQEKRINFSYLQSSDDSLLENHNPKSSLKINQINDSESSDFAGDPVKSSITFLFKFEFIRLHLDDDTKQVLFVPTRLGLACLSSSMPPKDGFLLFSELQKSRQNFVLESELHAIYLVTPFSVAYQIQNIDWIHFAELHDKLPIMMKRVAELVGVSASYLIKAITGRQGNDWKALQVHKRFYASLALQELVNEVSITEVSAKYKIPRGLLQNLQQMSSTFAGIVTTFCKSMQWNLLALILAQFRERLFFGIHPDLIDLMKITSMSTRTARVLHKNGIENLKDLAISKTLRVENILMDLGDNFFLVGKSLKVETKDLAKLLIDNARNHIQHDLGLGSGLGSVKWDKEPNNTQPYDLKGTFEDCKKRRAQTPLKLNPNLISNNSPNTASKALLDTSIEYRKKLRSSGGSNDFATNHQTFTLPIEQQAENSISEISENASTFIPEEEPTANLGQKLWQQIEIVDVSCEEIAFDTFKKDIKEQKELGVSVGVGKFQLQNKIIGGNLLRSNGTQAQHNFVFDESSYIDCICISFSDDRVYYLNLQENTLITCSQFKRFLEEILSRKNLTLHIYEAREQLKVLCKVLERTLIIQPKVYDPRLGCWMIDPDSNLNWHDMIKKFSPEHLNIIDVMTLKSTFSSLGLHHTSTMNAKARSVVECYLSNILIRKELDEMKNTGKGLLSRVFCDLEMPIQTVLMKMEITGFPVSYVKLNSTIDNARLLQRQLERHIYQLNGQKFNLSSSKAVSEVIGIRNNLGKKKVSTAKNVLEKLDLPIAKSIMMWRTLTKTISNIQPMTKLVNNGRIYANSFSLTQTGRISMYEPNLQNVTKDFNVKLKDQKGTEITEIVSFRQVFECREGNVLLSADFCQLELRVLTHLSKDKNLLQIMNTLTEDIFKKIAAKWNNIDESQVSIIQRNQTKQICYGIIYGMGNKSLAETMNIDEEESRKLAEEFHASYPGIRRFKEKVIEKARSQGFVETVTCRRRYLSAINSESSSDRSQAERQALNTCIQGSASDLVKNAILRMDRNLKINKLEDCELVLHLHDELFYELPESKLQLVSKVLINSMEKCVKLSVPLLVKLKYGSNWRDMKEIQ